MGPLNFSRAANTVLRFQRWLNTDVQQYASATIDVSADGTNWSSVFSNDGSAIADAAWTQVAYDISATADGQPAVYVRWGYQIASGAFAYSGWNIDDIELLGLNTFLVTLPASATGGGGLLAGLGHVSVPTAPAANLIVSLASGDASQVAVPASVTIMAGQTNANFNLTILDDGLLDGTRPVTIAASAFGYAPGSNSISIFDKETAVLGVTLPAAATEGDGQVSGMLTSSAAPNDDVQVSLVSSDPGSLQGPATVVLPAGQLAAAFFATVLDDHKINGGRMVTVTAHVQNWTDGAGTMTIHDNLRAPICCSRCQRRRAKAMGC